MELLKELEGIIDNLTKKYNKIKEEKEALKKENEELYAEYENLTRERDMLKNQIEDFKKKEDDMEKYIQEINYKLKEILGEEISENTDNSFPNENTTATESQNVVEEQSYEEPKW